MAGQRTPSPKTSYARSNLSPMRTIWWSPADLEVMRRLIPQPSLARPIGHVATGPAVTYRTEMVMRKIVFYRWMHVNGRAPFVPHEAAGRVAQAIDADPYASVLEGNDTTTAVEVGQAGDSLTPARFRVMALRNPGNRPVQWELGNGLKSLQLLDDQYPADVTNVAIWPNGIAAQDLTRDSPRMGRLSHFLRHRANAFVSFEPLYRPDMYERLMRMRGKLRSVHLAMTKPEYLDRDRGVFGTLVPEIWGPKAPSINVQIGVGRYGSRDRFLDHDTEETVFRIAEQANDFVDRLIVRGIDPATNKVETVSLLNERLQKEVDIPTSPDTPEIPDALEAFKEIDRAFRNFEVEGSLRSAIQAQLMHE